MLSPITIYPPLLVDLPHFPHWWCPGERTWQGCNHQEVCPGLQKAWHAFLPTFDEECQKYEATSLSFFSDLPPWLARPVFARTAVSGSKKWSNCCLLLWESKSTWGSFHNGIEQFYTYCSPWRGHWHGVIPDWPWQREQPSPLIWICCHQPWSGNQGQRCHRF